MKRFLSAALLLMLTACASAPTPQPALTLPQSEIPASPLTPVQFSDLPGWESENFAEAIPVFAKSCSKISDSDVNAKKIFGDAASWRAACARLPQRADNAAARQFFERNFRPYRIGNAPGLFTGYYEASLRCAMRADKKYRYPLYRMPDDAALQLTRAEIDAGALRGKKLELLWCDDPVAVYSLHVQGSGRVTLPDGQTRRIGFAGKNAHPYTSIGKVFGERGLVPKDRIEMATIEDWLRRNPKDAAEILQNNRSYIFFRDIKGDGPVGAMGLALTPGRSLAVDREIFPLGVPLWLDISGPRLQRLTFAQDTGSAIKGLVRGDYFWGAGENAKREAGAMRGRGTYYALLPQGGALLTQNDAGR